MKSAGRPQTADSRRQTADSTTERSWLFEIKMSGVLHDMHLQMRHQARAGATALDRMSHNTVSYRGPDDLVMAKPFPRSLLLPA